MQQSTWQRLERQVANNPILFAGPVAAEEVEAAARELGVRFDADYVEFVCRFGGAMVGAYPIFGLRLAEVMGVDNLVVAETRRFRDERWPGIDGWYVISTDGYGNPVGMDPAGRVWLSDHGEFDGHPEVVARASTFEAFVLELLG